MSEDRVRAELPATYPCPACRAEAGLAAGCPGCGRPPDLDAAEVIRLNQEITALVAEEERHRQALAEVTGRLVAVRRRREELSARIRTSVVRGTAGTEDPGAPAPRVPVAPGTRADGGTTPPVGSPEPPPVPTAPTPPPAPDPVPPAPRPVRSEVSGRNVQTLLFVTGGLLLGIGAVVFVVVAWSRLDVVGQAAVLAGLTVLAMLGAPLARRRRLPGTAETLAVLAVLMVVLDGYAGWRAGLSGGLSGSTWAGAVCAGTALIAVGYARVTRLAGPRFAALVLAQPALPLLAVTPFQQLPDVLYRFSAAGYLLALLAACDLVVGWSAGLRDGTSARPDGRRAGVGGVKRALRILAWVAAGGWLGVATLAALLAVTVAGSVPAGTVAGGALLACAVTLLVVAASTGSNRWWAVAGAGLVVAVTVALGRLAVLGWPDWPLAGITVVTVAVAVVAPRPVLGDGPTRGGRRAGALALIGVLAAPVAALTVGGAVAAAHRALFRTGGTLGLGGPYDWQLPLAVTLLAVGAAALVPRNRYRVAVVGSTLLALAVPPALPLPWWSPAGFDLAVAAVLVLAGLRAGRGPVVTTAVAGALLAGHALLVGLATATSAAAVLGAFVVLGGLVAVVAHRAAGPPAARLVVGRAGLLAAALAWPPTVLSTLAATGVPTAWWAPAATAAAASLLVLAWSCRRATAGYDRLTAGVVHVVTPVALLAGLTGEDGRLVGVYAVTATLVLVVLGLIRRPADRRGWLLARSPGAVAVVLAALPPLLAVLVGPVRWLERSWQGAPSGVGATVGEWPGHGPAALGLALLVAVAGLAGWVVTGRPRAAVVAALPVAPPALLVGIAELGAPWPVLPAVTLLLAAAAVLRAALADDRWSPLVAGYGLVLAVPGLAGASPSRWTTVAALSVVVAVAGVVTVAGRRRAARVPGALVTVGCGVLLAVAVTRAAELPWVTTPYAVLAVAASAVLASAVAEGGRGDASPAPERVAVELAGHAAALLALVLSVGSPPWSAVVAVLWGVVLGVRALAGAGPGRVARAVAGGGCQLLAWWLLLLFWQQSMVELYTLPAVLFAVVVGFRARRRRPELGSWLAYGPALAAAALPSLFLTLAAPEPARRLLLGSAAVAVLVAGARWRLQAPAVAGGAVAAVVAVRELGLLWQRLDAWIPLTAAGLLLIGLAASYERRRRDLTRLREALRRMS